MQKALNVICPFCSCLCDDLTIEFEAGTIQNVKNACSLAKEKYLSRKPQEPRALVAGEKAALTEAVQLLAKDLVRAKHILIAGLAEADGETQVEAIKLAEYLGASIAVTTPWPGRKPPLNLWPLFPSCTLGEIKNRADVLIFWNCDPLATHPRLLEHYLGVDRVGGAEEKGRTMVVIDDHPTGIASQAKLFIQLQEKDHFEALTFLRAKLRAKKLAGSIFTGETEAKLEELCRIIREASLGVIFLGEGGRTRQGMVNHMGAFRQELNQLGQFHLLPLDTSANFLGAEAVMTWQTGYPYGVNFSRGYPRYVPQELLTTRLVQEQGIDGIFLVGLGSGHDRGQEKVAKLPEVPLYVLGPHYNSLSFSPDIYLPAGQLGIEVAGTAFRLDQVPFYLPRLLDSAYADSWSILKMLGEEVKGC